MKNKQSTLSEQTAALAGRVYERGFSYIQESACYINLASPFMNEIRDKNRYYASKVLQRIKDSTEAVKFCASFQKRYLHGKELRKEKRVLELAVSDFWRACEKISWRARKFRSPMVSDSLV